MRRIVTFRVNVVSRDGWNRSRIFITRHSRVVAILLAGNENRCLSRVWRVSTSVEAKRTNREIIRERREREGGKLRQTTRRETNVWSVRSKNLLAILLYHLWWTFTGKRKGQGIRRFNKIVDENEKGKGLPYLPTVILHSGRIYLTIQQSRNYLAGN